MENIESGIAGSEKLTTVFGYWPSFHDAEVLELHFDRGDIQPDKGIYKFPVLTLKIHVWELMKEVDSKGYLVLRHHMITTLNFCDVSDFQMQGFNHQNSLLELCINSQQRSKGPSPYFAVKLEPAFGMGASFECLRIEVIDALPSREDGQVLSASSEQNR